MGDASTVPLYRTLQIYSRPKKAMLIEAINSIPAKYRGDPQVMPKTNAEKIDLIRAAREAYFDDHHAKAQRGKDGLVEQTFPGRKRRAAKKTKVQVSADLCVRTADEVNQNLRAMPPVPLWGEEE